MGKSIWFPVKKNPLNQSIETEKKKYTIASYNPLHHWWYNNGPFTNKGFISVIHLPLTTLPAGAGTESSGRVQADFWGVDLKKTIVFTVT